MGGWRSIKSLYYNTYSVRIIYNNVETEQKARRLLERDLDSLVDIGDVERGKVRGKGIKCYRAFCATWFRINVFPQELG